ncbi:MAG TPA: EAL domain-containing protein, partial [Ilumatobacteraceae bacterium]
MGWFRLGALLAGVVLVGVSVGLGVLSVREDKAALDRALLRDQHKYLDNIEEYFSRARDLMMLQAQNDAFSDFYGTPGERTAKIRSGDRHLDSAVASLGYLQSLYNGRIGEICFIDQSGGENARLVWGTRAATDDLSADESKNLFFAPTVALGVGQVYQAAAYISPDTNDLVISNSTMLPNLPVGESAMIHFEVAMSSFGGIGDNTDVRFVIVDARTGFTLADSYHPGAAGKSRAFSSVADAGDESGLITVGTGRVAFQHMHSTASNANDWYVIATAPAVDTGLGGYFGLRTIILVGSALVLFLCALASFRGYQRRLEYAAVTDALTSLPNRNLLCDSVEDALAERRRSGGQSAVMILDLDRFKEVNDTLGHFCGDQLLAAIGPRIRGGLRDGDTIARLGGDEFGLLLPLIHGGEEAVEVAQRILDRLREPFQIGDLALQVEASIGVAIAPHHGDNYTELLQHADTAMYLAKQSGLGVSLYDTDLDSHDPHRLAMLSELRRALDEGELELYYQPKTFLPSDELHGVEALLRWNHPERGLIAAAQFIPYAEHTALIQPITDWVIERAITDIRRWLDSGREINVSINVSARSLHDHHVCDTIAEQLELHGVPSRLLVVEITETAIMTEPAKAREILLALNQMGVELSIDDFGTGQTSLAYLTTLPIHELKIDRSFVTHMHERNDDAVIVRSVIDLGHNLGLRVVAEGIESSDTCRQLLAAGCQMGQGYLW